MTNVLGEMQSMKSIDFQFRFRCLICIILLNPKGESEDNTKQKQPSKEEQEKASSTSESALSRLVKRFVEVDSALTQTMAVAATPASPLGCLRPVFKILEFSCHGVPWLLLALTLLLIGEAIPSG